MAMKPGPTIKRVLRKISGTKRAVEKGVLGKTAYPVGS